MNSTHAEGMKLMFKKRIDFIEIVFELKKRGKEINSNNKRVPKVSSAIVTARQRASAINIFIFSDSK